MEWRESALLYHVRYTAVAALALHAIFLGKNVRMKQGLESATTAAAAQVLMNDTAWHRLTKYYSR